MKKAKNKKDDEYIKQLKILNKAYNYAFFGKNI